MTVTVILTASHAAPDRRSGLPRIQLLSSCLAPSSPLQTGSCQLARLPDEACHLAQLPCHSWSPGFALYRARSVRFAQRKCLAMCWPGLSLNLRRFQAYAWFHQASPTPTCSGEKCHTIFPGSWAP
jgi:hypothetical protein